MRYLELCDDSDDARRASSHEYSASNSRQAPLAVGRIVPRPRKEDCSAHAESDQHAHRQGEESDGDRVNQHRDQKFFYMRNVQLSARRYRNEGDHKVIDVTQTRKLHSLKNLENIWTADNPCN